MIVEKKTRRIDKKELAEKAREKFAKWHYLCQQILAIEDSNFKKKEQLIFQIKQTLKKYDTKNSKRKSEQSSCTLAN